MEISNSLSEVDLPVTQQLFWESVIRELSIFANGPNISVGLEEINLLKAVEDAVCFHDHFKLHPILIEIASHRNPEIKSWYRPEHVAIRTMTCIAGSLLFCEFSRVFRPYIICGSSHVNRIFDEFKELCRAGVALRFMKSISNPEFRKNKSFFDEMNENFSKALCKLQNSLHDFYPDLIPNFSSFSNDADEHFYQFQYDSQTMSNSTALDVIFPFPKLNDPDSSSFILSETQVLKWLNVLEESLDSLKTCHCLSKSMSSPSLIPLSSYPPPNIHHSVSVPDVDNDLVILNKTARIPGSNDSIFASSPVSPPHRTGFARYLPSCGTTPISTNTIERGGKTIVTDHENKLRRACTLIFQVVHELDTQPAALRIMQDTCRELCRAAWTCKVSKSERSRAMEDALVLTTSVGIPIANHADALLCLLHDETSDRNSSYILSRMQYIPHLPLMSSRLTFVLSPSGLPTTLEHCAQLVRCLFSFTVKNSAVTRLSDLNSINDALDDKAVCISDEETLNSKEKVGICVANEISHSCSWETATLLSSVAELELNDGRLWLSESRTLAVRSSLKAVEDFISSSEINMENVLHDLSTCLPLSDDMTSKVSSINLSDLINEYSLAEFLTPGTSTLRAKEEFVDLVYEVVAKKNPNPANLDNINKDEWVANWMISGCEADQIICNLLEKDQIDDEFLDEHIFDCESLSSHLRHLIDTNDDPSPESLAFLIKWTMKMVSNNPFNWKSICKQVLAGDTNHRDHVAHNLHKIYCDHSEKIAELVRRVVRLVRMPVFTSTLNGNDNNESIIAPSSINSQSSSLWQQRVDMETAVEMLNRDLEVNAAPIEFRRPDLHLGFQCVLPLMEPIQFDSTTTPFCPAPEGCDGLITECLDLDIEFTVDNQSQLISKQPECLLSTFLIEGPSSFNIGRLNDHKTMLEEKSKLTRAFNRHKKKLEDLNSGENKIIEVDEELNTDKGSSEEVHADEVKKKMKSFNPDFVVTKRHSVQDSQLPSHSLLLENSVEENVHNLVLEYHQFLLEVRHKNMHYDIATTCAENSKTTNVRSGFDGLIGDGLMKPKLPSLLSSSAVDESEESSGDSSRFSVEDEFSWMEESDKTTDSIEREFEIGASVFDSNSISSFVNSIGNKSHSKSHSNESTLEISSRIGSDDIKFSLPSSLRSSRLCALEKQLDDEIHQMMMEDDRISSEASNFNSEEIRSSSHSDSSSIERVLQKYNQRKLERKTQFECLNEFDCQSYIQHFFDQNCEEDNGEDSTSQDLEYLGDGIAFNNEGKLGQIYMNPQNPSAEYKGDNRDVELINSQQLLHENYYPDNADVKSEISVLSKYYESEISAGRSDNSSSESDIVSFESETTQDSSDDISSQSNSTCSMSSSSSFVSVLPIDTNIELGNDDLSSLKKNEVETDLLSNISFHSSWLSSFNEEEHLESHKNESLFKAVNWICNDISLRRVKLSTTSVIDDMNNSTIATQKCEEDVVNFNLFPSTSNTDNIINADLSSFYSTVSSVISNNLNGCQNISTTSLKLKSKPETYFCRVKQNLDFIISNSAISSFEVLFDDKSNIQDKKMQKLRYHVLQEWVSMIDFCSSEEQLTAVTDDIREYMTELNIKISVSLLSPLLIEEDDSDEDAYYEQYFNQIAALLDSLRSKLSLLPLSKKQEDFEVVLIDDLKFDPLIIIAQEDLWKIGFSLPDSKNEVLKFHFNDIVSNGISKCLHPNTEASNLQISSNLINSEIYQDQLGKSNVLKTVELGNNPIVTQETRSIDSTSNEIDEFEFEIQKNGMLSSSSTAKSTHCSQSTLFQQLSKIKSIIKPLLIFLNIPVETQSEILLFLYDLSSKEKSICSIYNNQTGIHEDLIKNCYMSFLPGINPSFDLLIQNSFSFNFLKSSNSFSFVENNDSIQFSPIHFCKMKSPDFLTLINCNEMTSADAITCSCPTFESIIKGILSSNFNLGNSELNNIDKDLYEDESISISNIAENLDVIDNYFSEIDCSVVSDISDIENIIVDTEMEFNFNECDMNPLQRMTDHIISFNSVTEQVINTSCEQISSFDNLCIKNLSFENNQFSFDDSIINFSIIDSSSLSNSNFTNQICPETFENHDQNFYSSEQSEESNFSCFIGQLSYNTEFKFEDNSQNESQSNIRDSTISASFSSSSFQFDNNIMEISFCCSESERSNISNSSVTIGKDNLLNSQNMANEIKLYEENYHDNLNFTPLISCIVIESKSEFGSSNTFDGSNSSVKEFCSSDYEEFLNSSSLVEDVFHENHDSNDFYDGALESINSPNTSSFCSFDSCSISSSVTESESLSHSTNSPCLSTSIDTSIQSESSVSSLLSALFSNACESNSDIQDSLCDISSEFAQSVSSSSTVHTYFSLSNSLSSSISSIVVSSISETSETSFFKSDYSSSSMMASKSSNISQIMSFSSSTSIFSSALASFLNSLSNDDFANDETERERSTVSSFEETYNASDDDFNIESHSESNSIYSSESDFFSDDSFERKLKKNTRSKSNAKSESESSSSIKKRKHFNQYEAFECRKEDRIYNPQFKENLGMKNQIPLKKTIDFYGVADSSDLKGKTCIVTSERQSGVKGVIWDKHNQSWCCKAEGKSKRFSVNKYGDEKALSLAIQTLAEFSTGVKKKDCIQSGVKGIYWDEHCKGWTVNWCANKLRHQKKFTILNYNYNMDEALSAATDFNKMVREKYYVKI